MQAAVRAPTRRRENADLIVLWGSNAREAHPIFFHHVLKAVHNGAKLMVVDPRRTPSAQWADLWLGLDVGTDIALANAVAREIIHAGLANTEFIERATTGFEAYRESVEPWTLEEAERVTGVPADAIRELAHAYAQRGRAQLCWTLGITEHHNAVDNVFALINLSLLTGHVGRYGSGLQPLRGQNNVQGGGDMGALPNRLPGFQDARGRRRARATFEAAWGATIPPRDGMHLTEMFEAMEHGDADARSTSSARTRRRARPTSSGPCACSTGLDHLVVQDLFLTRDGASSPTSCFPAAATLVRGRGHRHARASAACSACARRSTRRARRATTSRSSTSSRARLGPRARLRRAPRTSGTSCARSRRCTRA